MRESLELFVWIFHLIVLSVENNGLLDLFNHIWIVRSESVVANAQFFNAEVRFQRFFYGFAANVADMTLKNF